MKLTIGIPTYNRNDILKRNFELLLPQLTDECCVLIMDNCSNVPVADTLAPIVAKYPSANITIIRNKTNIGATANYFRLMESCETEWMWLLGDDDPPLPNAVQTVLKRIRDYPDCVLLNFYSKAESHPVRTAPVESKGLVDFIRSIDALGSVIFVSCCVYRIPRLLRNLHIGYHFAFSLIPQLAITLASIGDDDRCCLLPDEIVKNGGLQTERELRCSVVTCALGIGSILDLPHDSVCREELAKKVAGATKVWLSWRGIVRELVEMGIVQKDTRHACYIYDQICARLFRWDTSIKMRLRIWIGKWLVRFPKFSYPLIRQVYSVIKHEECAPVINDRFARF